MTVKPILILGPVLGVVLAGLLVMGHAASEGEHMNDVKKAQTATLAGGCFWCIESDLEKLDGVIRVVSGYAGGTEPAPTYEQVCTGTTGHREAVQVTFDPERITYRELLDFYWKSFDPTDRGGSFGDRGFQYTSAIFTHSEEQQRVAEASRDILDDSGVLDGPVVTPVLPFTTFYPAEDYHQDFSRTCPVRYKSYRQFSGRDRFIQKTWGERKKAESAPGRETGRRVACQAG